MSADDRILCLIEAFYDAALDDALWPAALKQLMEFTGSQASSFWVLNGTRTPGLPTFVYNNFDPTSVQEYLDIMAPLDPTVRHLVAHPHDLIVHDGLLTNEQDKESRTYYDWHERKIETRFRMVSQARLGPEVAAGVALHRTRKAGRYEARDVERFTLLHRHLQRALAIGARLGSLGAMQQFSNEWLEQNSVSAVLLNRRGRIVFANRSAQALQSSGDGIQLSPNGIHLTYKPDHTKLQSLIARSLARTASPNLSTGGTLSAARPSGKRPYEIFVTPIAKQCPALAVFRPAVVVLIADPERQSIPSVEHLMGLFDLTRAEARLAALLADGEDLRVAAEKLHITYGTARSRLNALFQKTATRRQGELIRLLLSVPSLC